VGSNDRVVFGGDDDSDGDEKRGWSVHTLVNLHIYLLGFENKKTYVQMFTSMATTVIILLFFISLSASDATTQSCSCKNGGSCDADDHCICKVGYAGSDCSIRFPDFAQLNQTSSITLTTDLWTTNSSSSSTTITVSAEEFHRHPLLFSLITGLILTAIILTSIIIFFCCCKEKKSGAQLRVDTEMHETVKTRNRRPTSFYDEED